jgi:hypothetical protein
MVIEDQVNKEMFFVEGKALLPRLEEEALAQFEQEMFNFINDGAFQVGFGILSFFVETKKLEHIGFLEQILGTGDKLAFCGELANILFAPAEGEALIKAGIELALEFRKSPTAH